MLFILKLLVLSLSLAAMIPSAIAKDAGNVMENLATPVELAAMLKSLPAGEYFVFTEDRTNSIRRTDSLPAHWLKRSEEERTVFTSSAQPGEFHVFQVGVYAARQSLDPLKVRFEALKNAAGESLPVSSLRCLNLGGIDSDGRPLAKNVRVPQGKLQALWIGVDVPADARGLYTGLLRVLPEGLPGTDVTVKLTVAGTVLADHGDGEAWRLSRLRWLDSTVAQDDHNVTAPFQPLEMGGHVIHCLGRSLVLGNDGLPAQIESFFSASNTKLLNRARPVLSGPVRFVVNTLEGPVAWKTAGFKLIQDAPDTVTWRVLSQAPTLDLQCDGAMEYDGFVRYRLALAATADVELTDVRLAVPYRRDAAGYWMGLGKLGGKRTGNLDWKWDIEKHQDCLWLGDVNAGAQWRFKGANFARPLVNIYYPFRKLNLPDSWGTGGIRVTEVDDTVQLVASSGARHLKAGESLRFDFDLYLTPFRPLDTDKQWATRFLHEAAIDKAGTLGANVLNLHHAQPINPYINYPYNDRSVGDLTAFVQQTHSQGLKAKVYYTTRELTTALPELWALHSLNGEVICPGPGNDSKTVINPKSAHPWLREHLRQDYIPAWVATLGGKYAGELDLAVITTPDSRWNNFYLEGLDWLVKHVGIDGLYLDDTALDRHSLQRARKILDRARPGSLIDFHSWNHFNDLARFASCANLYMEIFPYLDRLWFGEGFNYDTAPDYWLIEMSGIPYGLMSEMLQDGGNAWRGMLFGMTGRLPGDGDPHHLWKFWDEFGLAGTEMIGWWDHDCPVKTGRDDVLATLYRKPGKALIALASWANTPQAITLTIDWAALGIDPSKARLTAPRIEKFQEAARFNPTDPIPVAPRRGWLMVLF